ncbi:MAG: hypothetical protein AVDCRST_MAG33-1514 [uncultured Thermomicrobiales bacterium]|uniref:Zinc finger CHC2-type domain-containing protein n=1 Tax=uncultured Thermomicrobiales bacterium TaxID=1645740 RepID=A0A6J4UUR2_9BACT|nr:MAG: hypothetical protein AVDCRST_MAG33-1514 [uncultured Thermomicrobiales bacterium]
MTVMPDGPRGTPIDPALIADLTHACEDREGRPISGGRELRFRCPVHAPDAQPSARWNPERAVWRCDACEAGGGAIALADLLGIRTSRSARWDWPTGPPPARPPIGPVRPGRPTPTPELTRPTGTDHIVAVYPYGDGRRVVRLNPKSFRPQHLVDGQWRNGRPDAASWPLYRQDELPADLTATVHVTEGEKDADTLVGLGWCAVSPGSSATPWQDSWTEALASRPVVIHADNDSPGRKRADTIAGRLHGRATSVRIADYDDLPPGGDVSDFLAANDAEALKARIDALTVAQPAASTVPHFPVDVFPPGVREFIERASASLSVPPEMIAAPLLSMTGAVIGNRLRLSLKGGFEVLPTLWVAVVAPPGSAKTPALGFARTGLESLQRRAHERFQMEHADWESRHATWKSSKSDDRGDEPRKPEMRHYWTANATTEALADRLTHAHGIALVADELTGWIRSMDQYRGGKGADRQTFLSLWSGSNIKIDRQSRPPTLINFPAVSVCGGIQDDMIATLHDERERRDGLIERIMFVRPEAEPAFWTEDEVPAYLTAEIERVFGEIDRIPPMDKVPVSIHLAADARTVWSAWYNSNTEATRSLSGLAQGFSSKWPVHTARLALVLHILWAASEGTDHRLLLTRDRLEDAIELSEWFRAHLDRVLPLLKATGSSQPRGLATRIVRHLRRAEGAWVTRSTLYNALRNVSGEQLSQVLTTMERDGLIEQSAGAAVTKPVQRWRLVSTDDPYYSDYPKEQDDLGPDQRPGTVDEPDYPNSTNVSQSVDAARRVIPHRTECVTCGGPLEPGQRARCASCVAAAHRDREVSQ